MLKIYLARHGQDEDNANGILNGHRNKPLTELGMQQARDLAENIRRIEIAFDAVYSSPLKRAYETAEAVTGVIGMRKPIAMASLIERNFGMMTGKSAKQIKRLCAPDIIETSTITYFLSPEGAETFPQLFARGKSVIDWVRGCHQDGNVLLVTHGDIGKMIYAAYYGVPWESVLTLFHFGNSELLLLSEEPGLESVYVFRCQQFNH